MYVYDETSDDYELWHVMKTTILVIVKKSCYYRQSASERAGRLKSCFCLKFPHLGSQAEMDGLTAARWRYDTIWWC